MTEVSRAVGEEQSFYMQSNYQICIAAVVASKNYQTSVVEMPTGSGKTWVQCLLAKYYCSLGKKVTIIEPNERLKLQTMELIGLVDEGITIVTPQWFYEFPNKDEVVMVNEYDELFMKSPFMATMHGI